VSALPDEKVQTNSSTYVWKYIYLCDTRLEEAKVPRIQLPDFRNDASEMSNILVGLLYQRGRKLKEEQLKYTMNQVQVEPTALYLNLSMFVISKWTSSSLMSACTVTSTVKGLINQVFDSLECQYGRTLTRYMIGFITFARAGKLSDDITLLSDDTS